MPRPLFPSEEYSPEQDAAVPISQEPISQNPKSRLGGDRPALRFKLLATVAVLAIASFSILPNYFTHDWSWKNPPGLAQASQLNRLQADGLTLPGWQTLEQQTVSISGSTWSVQAIQRETNDSDAAQSTWSLREARTSSRRDRPILVMLRPQVWHREQPQVEWMDINGAQQWTADHRQSIFLNTDEIESSSSSLGGSESEGSESGDRAVPFRARYFRGWSRQQTYAVVQWYAWTTGGSPAISSWFWADQWQQWRDRQRMPWVAVTILIPIEPLGNIETARTIAKSLSQTLQAQLIHDVLTNPT